MEKRVRLSEQDFKDLVGGKEVEQNGVKIILDDIGYCKMMSLTFKHIKKFEPLSVNE